jgi:hypothetical protein
MSEPNVMDTAGEDTSPVTTELLDQLAATDRLAVRRHRVLSLTLRRMNQDQIAQALNVNQATVSRDLHWIRHNWRDAYGIPATVSPAEEIGMAVALYEDAETAALREFHSINTGPTTNNSRHRMACLRTAMLARQMRTALLQDVGIVDRQVGTVTVTSARADDIRTILRDEGILGAKRMKGLLAAPDELDGGGLDEEGISKWLKRE